MAAWTGFTGAAVLALLAQTPQFRSGIDVVRFDVVVLDSARHPIPGLTQEDFRITEDGKPVRIAGFEAVTIPGADQAARPALTDPDPRVATVTNRRDVPGRLVVIVMDRTIPHEWPLTHARAIANAAIDSLGPNDIGAVLFTSRLAGARPQGFTADRTRLRAAVDSLQMGATVDVKMGFTGMTRGGAHYNPGECMCGLCTIDALTNIAAALASVPDYRKMILFIGTDVPLSENSNLARSEECRGRMTEPSGKLFQTLDRANVTIHTFDPIGLDTSAQTADNTPAESPDSRQIRHGELKTLPDYTGGRMIAQSNDEAKLVPAVFNESRTYYVVAIERGPAAKGGKLHAVKIQVARPDATVLNRSSYFDPSPDAAKKPAADPLERALSELLPRTDLPLRMTLKPGATKNASLDVTLATPRATPVRADVLVGVFDEFAKEVGVERAKVELPARSGGEVEWPMHLNPKPGRYEIRAAVRIGDQIGTVIGHVEVRKAPR
jgi:VWFA-related protein